MTGTYLHSVDKIWAGVVCEADRISNPDAQTTRKVKQLRTKKRVALTGTPVSNKPEDVWSIIDWLYPRYLGTLSHFQEKYCVMQEFALRSQQKGKPQTFKKVMRYQNLGDLRDRLEPIMLRRQKEDVLVDFPAKTTEYIRFDLSPTERNVYESVRKMILKEIRAMTNLDTRSLAILPVKMLRLKQATDHLALIEATQEAYTKSSKLELMREMLRPLWPPAKRLSSLRSLRPWPRYLKRSLRTSTRS
jgi:SNF2 family DNA or RNA helicase